MKNLILDPLAHAPYLKHVIPESLYYVDSKLYDYPQGFCNDDFKTKYNFDYEFDIMEIKKNKISNLFIIYPILSVISKHEGPRYMEWIHKFKTLINKYKDLVNNKIILCDTHAYDYDPSPVLEFVNADIILKRVFTKRDYKFKNIYPYPFLMCTINDPFYKLINSQILSPVKKRSKILWSGTLFEHHEKIDNVCDEYTNRKGTLIKLRHKYNKLVDVKSVPYNNFLNLLNSYKYSLDLRGCSRLNKRLFEILSTNSLLLAEKIDVVWPFDEGDKFSDECFFEQGNIDDLYRIYNNFENDICLYHRCLENQIFIVKKYFNKEWLWNYIKNIIETY